MTATTNPITREMFFQYEVLRCSGLINMFGARLYLGWEKDEFAYLIKHYSELVEQYKDVMDEAREAGESLRRHNA